MDNSASLLSASGGESSIEGSISSSGEFSSSCGEDELSSVSFGVEDPMHILGTTRPLPLRLDDLAPDMRLFLEEITPRSQLANDLSPKPGLSEGSGMDSARGYTSPRVETAEPPGISVVEGVNCRFCTATSGLVCCSSCHNFCCETQHSKKLIHLNGRCTALCYAVHGTAILGCCRECAECGIVVCETSAHPDCGLDCRCDHVGCQKTLCLDCYNIETKFSPCGIFSGCPKKLLCSQHRQICQECLIRNESVTTYCSSHITLFGPSAGNVYFCDDHIVDCSICGQRQPSSHSVECSECEAMFCNTCVSGSRVVHCGNESCLEPVCRHHRAFCNTCDLCICTSCGAGMGRCHECNGTFCSAHITKTTCSRADYCQRRYCLAHSALITVAAQGPGIESRLRWSDEFSVGGGAGGGEGAGGEIVRGRPVSLQVLCVCCWRQVASF